MYNKVRNCFPGGDGADRSADGPRRELQCIEGATVESTNTRSWMLPIVAPRGRRQGQPSCKRRRRRALGSLGDGVAVCRTRRVVSFGLIGRFLYVSWESGRTRLRVCLDDGAPAGMTWLSPKAVLARCLAPDIEALTSAPAFQQSYWSNQHAALVSRSVCRQQCPHPCFLPAATRADSAGFAA